MENRLEPLGISVSWRLCPGKPPTSPGKYLTERNTRLGADIKMNSVKKVYGVLLLAVVLLFTGAAVNAQKSQVRSRVTAAVDETRTVKVQGNVHPMARSEFDRGALGDSTPMTRMLILLQRSTDQEQALRQVMEDQQTKSSANYHKWLTPTEFGLAFGPSDADVQAVTDWLVRAGFRLPRYLKGARQLNSAARPARCATHFKPRFTNSLQTVQSLSPTLPIHRFRRRFRQSLRA